MITLHDMIRQILKEEIAFLERKKSIFENKIDYIKINKEAFVKIKHK